MGSLKMAALKKRIFRCEHAAWNWLPRKTFLSNIFHLLTFFFPFSFDAPSFYGGRCSYCHRAFRNFCLEYRLGSSFRHLGIYFSVFFGLKILGSSFYSFQQLTLLYTHLFFSSLAHLHPPPPHRFLFIVHVHVLR